MKAFYTLENITLYQANCLNSSLFKKEFIDLIVTSPPYNVGLEYNSTDDNQSYEEYLEFSKKWITNCFRWSRPQARFCLNIPLDKNKGGYRPVGSDLTRIAQECGWKYKFSIIWNEGNISRRTAWGSWMSASAPIVISPVELIVVFYKDQWKKTDGSKISDIHRDEFLEWTNGLWTFNGESKKKIGHPAPFPKELPFRCIKMFSYKGDVVFDPFCWSGTTLIVANNLNRKAIGVEIDENYCRLSQNRIINETNKISK